MIETAAQQYVASRDLERPAISRDNQFFFDGLTQHELRIQRCCACLVLRHPPRPVCAVCGARDWDWIISAGRGDVYSYTVVWHPPVPGRQMPYAVALVELDEGVRVLAPLLDVQPEPACIGTRVEAIFLDHGDFTSLAVGPPS